MAESSRGTRLADPVGADWRPDLTKSAHDIREYLEEQDAYVLFDSILKDLLTKQPDDPVDHILHFLKDEHPPPGPIREQAAEIVHADAKPMRQLPRSKGPRLPPRVVVLGPPGVSVHENAQRLASKLGAVFVNGMALQAAATMPKSKGAIVTPLQGEHRLELIGMDLTNLEALSAKDPLGLVGVRLRQPDCVRRGWVLRGFPTTQELATVLAKDADLAPLRVIALQASVETCISRLRDRYIDKVTGEIRTSMPEEPAMRERWIQQPEDAVTASHQAYGQSINSVLSGLQAGPKQRRCVELAADGPAEAVFQEMLEFVERPLPLLEP